MYEMIQIKIAAKEIHRQVKLVLSKKNLTDRQPKILKMIKLKVSLK